MRDGDVMTGTVQRAALGESRAKGTPYVGLQVRLQNGEELRCDIWLTDKAMGMARRQLKVLGFDIDAHDLGQIGVLVGQTAEFTIESEDWNGQIRYRATIATAAESVSPSKMAELTAKLRAAKGDGSKHDAPASNRFHASEIEARAAAAPRPAPPVAARPAPAPVAPRPAPKLPEPGSFNPETDDIPF